MFGDTERMIEWRLGYLVDGILKYLHGTFYKKGTFFILWTL